MRILFGCECSGVGSLAMRERGHEVWSCDLVDGAIPEWHLRMDVKGAILSRRWDIIVLHPPCTSLSLSGNGTYAGTKKRSDALDWTESLWKLACKKCPRVGLEQPKSVLGQRLGKRTQAVHPWMFGHTEQKETWLWLHNLPPLTETNNVYEAMMKLPERERCRIWYMGSNKDRRTERSITYQGIADAMAEQWGSLV